MIVTDDTLFWQRWVLTALPIKILNADEERRRWEADGESEGVETRGRLCDDHPSALMKVEGFTQCWGEGSLSGLQPDRWNMRTEILLRFNLLNPGSSSLHGDATSVNITWTLLSDDHWRVQKKTSWCRPWRKNRFFCKLFTVSVSTDCWCLSGTFRWQCRSQQRPLTSRSGSSDAAVIRVASRRDRSWNKLTTSLLSKNASWL